MDSHNNIENILATPFFFILGRPRSGTTLLRSLLDAHRNVNIPPEHINLIHLYFKYSKKNKPWKKSDLEIFYKDFSDHPAIRNLWKLNDEKVKGQLFFLQNKKASFADMLKIIYANYESLYPKGKILFFGDKSPINSLYANKIFNLFPKAKFIHLVRDYRGNLSSMLKYEVFSPSVTTIVSQWKMSVNQINRLAKKHPDFFYTLRYEDLVENPEKYFSEICYFLNIPILPEVFDREKRKEIIEKEYPPEFIKEWHPDLVNEISIKNIQKWKLKLRSQDIKTADFIAGKTAERFHYQRLYHKFNFAFYLFSYIKIFAFFVREIQRHVYDRLPYRWKIKIRNRKIILSKEILLAINRLFGKK